MFLGIALFVMTGVANAQVKIAHVNTAEILDAMPDKAKAEQDLEKYYTELQNQLQAMAREYQTKMQDYEANQATMSNLVRQSKEKEIVDLQTRIQQFQLNAEEEFEKKLLALVEDMLTTEYFPMVKAGGNSSCESCKYKLLCGRKAQREK